MGIRRTAAVWAARLISAACRLAGKQGTTMAGTVALKIDPTILKALSSQVGKGIIVVCGTNGKTTTNNLICSALEAEGYKVVCNRAGANMLSGVTAAFVLGASAAGRIDADYACIEVDEAYARKLFAHLSPSVMVITNLFRDQLDRYGEIDITMDFLKEAIDMVPDMELVYNADDSLTAYLALESGHVSHACGVGEPLGSGADTGEIREGRFCKRCSAKLEYDFYHYSQLGKYHCPQCGFKRPELEFDARDVSTANGLSFTVGGEALHADYRGFYNIYNMLEAYAVLSCTGAGTGNFNKAMASFHPQNGRNEPFRIGGTDVLLNLAKNPAGFNQNISAVMEDASDKDIIIVINDNVQDGTDISWLWDVDFERFSDPSVRSVTVSGIRCQDMRLRLKYADMKSDLIGDVESAIKARLEDGCGNLYVLVNYTALYSTHRILTAMQKNA